MAKFDYKKAEADLHDSGARHPDEIYSYKSEKAIRGYMKENGLNPDKYYKPDGKSNHSKSGSNSGSGTEGCYLTSACVAASARATDSSASPIPTYCNSARNAWPKPSGTIRDMPSTVFRKTTTNSSANARPARPSKHNTVATRAS